MFQYIIKIICIFVTKTKEQYNVLYKPNKLENLEENVDQQTSVRVMKRRRKDGLMSWNVVCARQM